MDQQFYKVRKTFAWFPKRVYRCFEHLSAPTGTWVWLQQVDVQVVPDINRYRLGGELFPDARTIVLCGEDLNPGLLPVDRETGSYSMPERKRLLVANKLVWESVKA